MSCNLYYKLSEFFGRDLFSHKTKIWLRRYTANILTNGAKKYSLPNKTVLDYDWDYLVLLDGCRYDLYKNTMGKTDYIISAGSNTPAWFKNTFEKGDYEEIIYVSGNPFVSKQLQPKIKNGEVSFFRLEPVWDYGWNKKLKTVPPERVTKDALECAEKYPSKKMIIHYMQPHYPFIGETKVVGTGIKDIIDRINGKKSKRNNVWDFLRAGEIKEKEAWRAYKMNLKLVIKEAENLKNNLEGKIALTSDHGNCIGEYGLYGHFQSRIEELVRVPWKVFQSERYK